MPHRKTFLMLAAALSAIVLAGFVSVSLTAEELTPGYPNDRANHHPLHPNG